MTSTRRRSNVDEPHVIKPGQWGLPTINLPGWKPFGQYSSTRHDGDLSIDADPAALAANRAAIIDLPWAWLRQVHGSGVVTVTRDTLEGLRGSEGDALVTVDPELVLAVQTADCAPVALASREGVIAIAHAGWRGIEAGVIDATVARMRELGATDIHGEVGPCIHVECYEFGAEDLERLARTFGEHVAGTTSWGTPALDLIQAVHAGLQANGVVGRGHGPNECTACGLGTDANGNQVPRYFSHRARGESERQATVIWREEPAPS